MKQPVRQIPPESLPGVDPNLLRELVHRISKPLLQQDHLPSAILICEGKEWEGRVLFDHKRYNLNITVFKPQPDRRGRGTGSGVFVVSNGAGVSTNVVDQLAPTVQVAGMIDLKQHFVASKIMAALRMAYTARPDLDALVLNMISGVALARETVRALRRFNEETGGRIPTILRFNGPRGEQGRLLLKALAEENDNVVLVSSTAELVRRTFDLLYPTAARARPRDVFGSMVREALSVRAAAKLATPPGEWLTPDRTLEHLFGMDEHVRVGVLGFGRTARFAVQAMREAGSNIVWAVTPSAGKHVESGIPGLVVYPTAAAAVADRGEVEIVLNYAPAAAVLRSTQDCVRDVPGMRLMLVVAENMPYDQTIRLMDTLESAQVDLIGPNAPGVVIAKEERGEPVWVKYGNIPTFLFHKAGGMSVVGRSGTVIFDIADQATDAGIGLRVVWAIGADKYTGLRFLEALVMLEQDSATRCIVINGEAGGIQE